MFVFLPFTALSTAWRVEPPCVVGGTSLLGWEYSTRMSVYSRFAGSFRATGDSSFQKGVGDTLFLGSGGQVAGK